MIFFWQHLKTATNFLTSVTSFFDSCINPRKTQNLRSDKASFKQNKTDALKPEKGKRPGTAPNPEKYLNTEPLNQMKGLSRSGW